SWFNQSESMSRSMQLQPRVLVHLALIDHWSGCNSHIVLSRRIFPSCPGFLRTTLEILSFRRGGRRLQLFNAKRRSRTSAGDQLASYPCCRRSTTGDLATYVVGQLWVSSSIAAASEFPHNHPCRGG